MDGMILGTCGRSVDSSHARRMDRLKKTANGLQDRMNFIDKTCVKML